MLGNEFNLRRHEEGKKCPKKPMNEPEHNETSVDALSYEDHSGQGAETHDDDSNNEFITGDIEEDD